MSAIEARNLTKRFGGVIAVDDVSFAVEPGEIVGLLGANGAGKTTTMKMLLGLLTPTDGQALIEGRPVDRAARKSMGYVPQGLGLYRDLTIAENLAFVADAYGVAAPSLDGTGLEPVATQRIGNVSLGIRRRTAFVAAGCHDPSVLILDEPTSGVGPLGRARLWETIHDVAEAGAAVLVSTHYMDEAERCHRLAILDHGRKAADGSPEELQAATGMSVIEVLAKDTQAAQMALRRLPEVVSVTQLGVRLRVLIPESVSNPLERVDRLFASKKIEASTELVSASLEDVFVAATLDSGDMEQVA